MLIDILTLFPDSFFGPFSESIIGRAIKENILKINAINIRDFSKGKHKTVDDVPYGGGSGMLMMAEPVCKAIESVKKEKSVVIMTSPHGEVFNQKLAVELSSKEHLVIVCGHYEGIDWRVKEKFIDREISVGDYITTNGNIPAMLLVDAISRLIPGVLGDDNSAVEESFSNNLLEYPQYTRPVEYDGLRVPDILLSGNHQAIKEWRLKEAIELTRVKRPDLYEKYYRETNKEE